MPFFIIAGLPTTDSPPAIRRRIAKERGLGFTGKMALARGEGAAPLLFNRRSAPELVIIAEFRFLKSPVSETGPISFLKTPCFCYFCEDEAYYNLQTKKVWN